MAVLQKIVAWLIEGVLLLVGFFVCMGILGTMLDGAAQYNKERTHCLKYATNGFEIQQCR